MKQKLIYIENGSTDPRYNLAFEEYVFSHVDELSPDGSAVPVLLLWRNGPSVIIGRYQNAAEEIDHEYIAGRGINVVRRNTGGGAVYHDLGNLNYSFVIPDAGTKVDFRTFTTPLVRALQSYGIPAEQTGRNDILVDGRKFSGNAQQFSKGRLLHHGTIMFDVDMEAVADALRVKPGKFRSKAVKSVRGRVVNLKTYFEGRTAGEAEDEVTDVVMFRDLLLDWFRREYDVTDVTLPAPQLEEIRRLKERKYDTYEWNFGRSPKADITRGDFFRCGFVEFHFSLSANMIRSVSVTGDFFSSGNIEEFEEMFRGCEYTPGAIEEVLRAADLEMYLGDVTAEELLAVII